MRRALITGITGQIGSYLADLLISKGYEVHGLIRRSSTFSTERIDHIYQDPHDTGRRLVLHYGDLEDGSSLRRVLGLSNPEEVYNLAAQSHVRVSFDCPEYTCDVDGMGTLRLLEAIRDHDPDGRVRTYQAGTSECFGSSPPPQNEDTPFRPRSPYACAKVFGFNIIKNYREAYGMHTSTGLVFNTESPRRTETFVTRKVTRAAARIKMGLQEFLYLGNMDAKRDWGFAGDTARAMWLILQQDRPDDYVIGTGRSYSVREWVEKVFAYLGLRWEDHVRIDERYFRPTEVNHLEADASKAKRVLGWKPTVNIDLLVAMMVEHDLSIARREKLVMDHS